MAKRRKASKGVIPAGLVLIPRRMLADFLGSVQALPALLADLRDLVTDLAAKRQRRSEAATRANASRAKASQVEELLPVSPQEIRDNPIELPWGKDGDE